MKKVFLFIFLLPIFASYSQPLRLNIMGGFANYTGDIQQKRFTMNQAQGVVTVGASFDLSNKFSLRSEYSFAHVAADDKFNSDPQVVERNLNFKTLIQELNIMGEYNFMDLNERSLSPYVFGGIGGFAFSPYTYNSAGAKIFLQGVSTEGQGLPQYPDRKVYKKLQLNIPVGGGIKYALSDDIQLGLELGVRKLFTDYLDDVSTTYVDQNILLQERGPLAVDVAFRGDELKTNPQPYPVAGSTRGGAKYKDFYYFGQFRIGFRLNWLGNGSGGGRSKYGCPANVL